MGQIFVMGISTLGFAVLARTMGPVPFSTFATLIFIFTVCSLATDLSPQGFLLVYGDGPRQRRAAQRSAVVSSLSGGALVLLLTSTVAPAVTGQDVTLIESTLLSSAVLFQVLGQLPRADLLLGRRYGPAALIDGAASLISVSFAVVVSLNAPQVWVLCAQLTVYSLLRLLLMSAFRFRSASEAHDDTGAGWVDAVRYGLRVLPLNVSAYLSRALDSGLLPGVIPNVAAASYARSYQVIVAPISQVQLSVGGAVLERLSNSHRDGRLDEASGRVWHVLLIFGAASAATIGGASFLIARVLFGHGWPMAEVFVSAMSCAIPGLFVAMYCSWQLQLIASARQSLRQLAIALLSPIGVLCASYLLGTRGALGSLVILALVTPSVMLHSQQALLPGAVSGLRAQLQLTLAWLPSAAIFLLVSTGVGFWTVSEWR